MSAAFTPGPWDWQASAMMSNNGLFHLYILDATDRKIAALWGKADEKAANANLIAAAPDGYEVVGKFIMAAINEYDIPEDADEGWILDTLGHGLGGAYMDAVAYRAKARGEAS